jgi:transposase-like protein
MLFCLSANFAVHNKMTEILQFAAAFIAENANTADYKLMRSKAVQMAVGLNNKGYKDIMGMWICVNENGSF